MSIKTDINEMMKNVQVEDEMKVNILNSTVRTQNRKGGRVMKKKIVVLGLVAAMCFGTIAVGADEIAKMWDSAIAKFYKVDEELEGKLVEEGYLENVEEKTALEEGMSVTNNGITVTINQIMASPYTLHVFFDVESEEGISVGERAYFSKCKVGFDEDVDMAPESFGMATSDIKFEDKDSNKGTCYLETELTDNQGAKKAKIVLTNILKSDQTIHEGIWEFDIEFETTDKAIKIDVDREIAYDLPFGQVECKIKNVEIYPMAIYIKRDQNHLDTNCHNVPIRIVMMDGTVYEDLNPALDWIEGNEFVNYPNYSTGNDYELRFIYEMIDINQIDYVEIVGEKYDVN